MHIEGSHAMEKPNEHVTDFAAYVTIRALIEIFNNNWIDKNIQIQSMLGLLLYKMMYFQ